MNLELKILKDFKEFKPNEVIEVEIEDIHDEGKFCCTAVYLDGEFICDTTTSFFKEHFQKN